MSLLRDAALDVSVPAGLRVVNLRKTFKHDCTAVSNSSFVMHYGELLAVLGANGSGKSTTCHVLCGITPATAGDALLDDQLSLLDRHHGGGLIGWCPQHDILFDQLTPLEHVSPFYTALMADLTVRCDLWGDKRCSYDLAEERLKRVRLWHRKDDRVGGFSGGMRRRLSMLLSTVGDPKLLILDEVCRD